jgi:Flp pilus assembly protein TadD
MRRDLLIGLLLAALALGVYWPVRHHDFIFFDDPQFITENPQVQAGLSWKTIVYAFTQSLVGNWHPVTSLSHALDCELFGVDAGAHHMVNALFHAGNAALLFILLRQLTRKQAVPASREVKDRLKGLTGPQNGIDTTWRCTFIAGIFALHPLRVESVAWIAERKDLLSGFFFLLTLLLYTAYVRDSNPTETGKGKNGKGRWGFYLGSLLSFALGLMSKPMLVTLPFVLLLLDYWPLCRLATPNRTRDFSNPSEGRVPRVPVQASRKKSHSWNSSLQLMELRRLLYEKLPFLLLSLLDCWITLIVQKGAGATQAIQGLTLWERLSNAITSYVRYLGKMFWPTDLSIVYPHPAKHYALSDQWPGWEIALAALLLVLVSVFCVLQLRQRPYLAVGWFWFLGTLVPVIGLVQVGEQAMADRYTYIPLIGPVIALVWGMGELVGSDSVLASAERRRKPTWVTLCGRGSILALLALLAVLTRNQLGYWQNTITLFDHAVAVTADNPSAQFSMGVGLEKEGQLGKAMVHYRVAVAIDPDYSKAYYNLGQLLRKAGRWQAAADAYLAAVRSNPTDLPTRLNLASVLPHLGRSGEAITWFNKVLIENPNSLEALNNLAWLLSTSPDSDLRNGARAVQFAERACSLTDSKTPAFLGTLAAAYAEAGRFGDAVTTAQNAAALATASGDSATAAKNQELLELYRANKPFRSPQ